MIGVDEALRLLRAEATAPRAVEVGLDHAHGLVLAEEIRADRDLPPAAVSTMDGFAVRSSDVPAPGAALRIAGEVRAGQAPASAVGPGEALRIFTGAIVPPSADAVVMVELTREDPIRGLVAILEPPTPGQHIRVRGEDAREGDTVIPAGSPIHAAEIAALAAVGRTRFAAFAPPAVSVLSTGDEVVPADRTPLPHQVRNSNAATLLASLRELGLVGADLGIAPDEPAEIDRRLVRGLEAEVLLITGGVSMGAYDLVGDALARAGMRLVFHEVAVRPGKPMLAGRCGPCLVVGLPGNPVSTFTAFAVFVAPTLRRMMGHPRPDNLTVRATLVAPLRRRPGRTTYHLARLEPTERGFQVLPIRTMGSGDVLSLSRANAFVVTQGAPDALAAGTEVTALPWRDFNLR